MTNKEISSIMDTKIGYCAVFSDKGLALVTPQHNALIVLSDEDLMKQRLSEQNREEFEVKPCLLKEVFATLDFGSFYAMDKTSYTNFQKLFHQLQGRDFEEMKKEIDAVDDSSIIVFGNIQHIQDKLASLN